MSRPTSVVKPLAAAVSSAVLFLSQPMQVLAQEELALEEVIVTAQIRAQSLQDVPVSVSAVNSQTMSDAAIFKIEDLQAYVPNLSMSETGIGTNLYIRGIGSGINPGFEQSVGMYMDGVYYGRGQLARQPFLDLERVETLRGPQVILFGKNSIAGAISMISAKPTDEPEVSISALYEPRYKEREITAVASGPLGGGFKGRLAYRYRGHDGYVENLTLNDDEPNRKEQTIRGILAWDNDNNLDMSLKYEQSTFDIKGRQIEIYEETPGAFNTTYAETLASLPGVDQSVLNNTLDYKRSSNGDFSDNKTQNATFALNYDMANDLSWNFITGYVKYDFDENCDCDFTGANVFNLPLGEDYRQISQEIRLVSPVGNTIDWIAGLYYENNKLEYNELFNADANSIFASLGGLNPLLPVVANTGIPRSFEQDSREVSVFAQGTWNINESWRLTLGGRYTDVYKKAERQMTITQADGSPLPPALIPIKTAVMAGLFGFNPNSVDGSRREKNFSPLVNVQWDVNNDLMTYFTAVRGAKSGGFDARSNAGPVGTNAIPAPVGPVGTFEYEDERATSFEVGLKTSFADGRADLNAAIFRTNYDDLQVSIFDGQLGFNVGNAAKAITQGFELDGRWLAFRNFTLTYSLAYLDFEFKDFENGQCVQGDPGPNGDEICDLSGKTNQYVSPWSGVVGGEYVLPLGAVDMRFRLDTLFRSAYHTSQTLDDNTKQSGYAKFNALIGIGAPDGKWEVALIGRNLTDRQTISYSGDTPLGNTLTGGGLSYYGFTEAPRTIALQGTFNFF